MVSFADAEENRGRLPVAVIVELIVTAEGCQSPLTNPEGEKHLCPCIHPHLEHVQS